MISSGKPANVKEPRAPKSVQISASRRTILLPTYDPAGARLTLPFREDTERASSAREALRPPRRGCSHPSAAHGAALTSPLGPAEAGAAGGGRSRSPGDVTARRIPAPKGRTPSTWRRRRRETAGPARGTASEVAARTAAQGHRQGPRPAGRSHSNSAGVRHGACAGPRPAPCRKPRGGAASQRGGISGSPQPGYPASSGLREAADRRAERRAARAGSSGRISSPRAPWGSAFCGVLAARAVGVQAVAWLLLCEAAGLSGTPAAPAGAGKKATCSEIILRQEVLKDGFHRDLLIKVKFGESIEDLQTCRLLIKQYIPTGLFVDPYELASLQESNITEAVMVSEDFNIEAPNYLSKESEVLIYARQDSQCIDCFQAFLPVHYRYHRPHSKDGETFIVVNNPDLLMYCDQELPILKCWAQSQVAAPCTLKNKDICQWNNMKYKSVFKNVTLQVPVGLTIHTSLVCSVTLLITILCSTLILLAVFKYGHFSL
ncbi:phosphatidylinositol-glycan biosynthesis class X protein [Vulpes vulpes]|uniref:Phosphatidylinositol-glycan biosynthesis class X protein n=1 Tax=Vulpes vulpes TaxID=9627 RepID=A0ABM4ZQ43_VULVU